MTITADKIAAALAPVLAQHGIPGAVAVVGSRAGTVAEAAVGTKAPGGPAMPLDAKFQIASMTKAVTSVAAMQLVEQGRLSLDAPMGELIPDVGAAQVLTGFADDGTPQLRAPKRPVTLRHLLSHTSGYGYEFMAAELVKWREKNPQVPFSRAALVTPLLADPGEGWLYGTSTDWAGLAVEAASGLKLGEWFARHIFKPLGMAETGFIAPQDVGERLVPLHARLPDGGLTPFPVSFNGGTSAEFDSGGGGLTSTAHDYLRFTRMLLNGGSLDGARVLKTETLAEMTKNQIGELRAGVLETTIPGMSSSMEWFPEMTAKWGLGFLINPETTADGRTAGSQAWAGIANSYYWFDPEKDVTGVLMMQFMPFGDPGALAVLGAFERAVYGK
jgi:CubicO group peptidase (beta-lactamase class C family)